MDRTLHFKITLMENDLPIWRKFQVTESYRMDRFHQVVQIVMGWHNAHLHEFRFQDRNIGMLLDDDFEFPTVEDETGIYLRNLSLAQGDMFVYLYDFGDSWEHTFQLEKISEGVQPNPFCTSGEGACPPEDCGGVRGYKDMLKVLKNPSDPEYDSWMEWLPHNFEPGRFPKDLINDELKRFAAWHREHPIAKSTPWHQLE